MTNKNGPGCNVRVESSDLPSAAADGPAMPSCCDLFEQAAVGLCEIDLSTGRFVRVNRRLCDMLGRSRDELTRMTSMEITHPEDLQEDLDQKQRLFAGEIRESVMEKRYLTSSGAVVWARMTASPLWRPGEEPLLAMAVVEDITERRAAQEERDLYRARLEDMVRERTARLVEANEALRESKALLESFFVSSPLMMGVTEHRNGHSIAIRLNPAVARLFGHPPDDLLGRTAVELGVPEDVERLWIEQGAKCRALRRSVREEFDFPTPAGRRRLASIMTCLGDGPDGFPRFSFVTEDITERQQLDTERQRAQRLEAIGMLAGGIAHDFNNLLQGGVGFVSVVRAGLEPQDPSERLLEQAEEAINSATALTSQLLAFSVGGNPVTRPVSLPPLIERATRFALSRSRCAHHLSLAPDLSMVSVDDAQIAEALHHVVTNASEAMGGVGTVEISASDVQVAPAQMPALPGGGSFVCVRVCDSGAGIPEEVRPSIFDPYFTTKPDRRGLGLATVYSILRRHGGAVDVHSRLGQGTEVLLYLPARPAPAEAPTAVRASVAPPARSRILLMDDEPLIRDVARLMVTSLGYDITCTADGDEAVTAYREALDSDRPYDLVLLDLTMKGGMGGEEAVVAIRALDPNAKVVVSTGYTDSPVVANHRAYGFTACLNKPYRLDSLRQLLGSLLGQEAREGGRPQGRTP